MAAAEFEHITTQKALEDYCQRTSGVKFIGFDTEFVSENRYRPDLCLLQVSADDRYAIIDTMAITNLMPFWDMLVEGDHVTVVHAAREEFLFCYRACGGRPKNLFDVQLAAGMVGFEYPASYGNLVSRLLNARVVKGETRTDWSKRPLTNSQIDYALSDVIYLSDLHKSLSKKLARLNRQEWMVDEMKNWQASLERSEDEPQWRRVSGISNLNRRALGIVRELWLARDEEAKYRNRAPRRILPDDLVVELAKRGTADIKRLKAIRGFENRVSKAMLEPISDAIQQANDLPEKMLPNRMPRGKSMNLGLLGQFLTTALNVVCRNQSIAPSIVGTANDIRSMAAWKLGMIELKQQPELAEGWRAEMVGDLVEQVLDGTIAIRVEDPHSDQPLQLEYLKK